MQKKPERGQDLVRGFQRVGQQEQAAQMPPPVHKHVGSRRLTLKPRHGRRLEDEAAMRGIRMNSMASLPGSLTPEHNGVCPAAKGVAGSGR
ncbi:hypothetical protein GCM10009546_32970 [Actinomadura livida]|uniref:Uncharacterized protein n=1 Tax=Actinomadura livida TaxID=79909 RepID=A0ABN1EJI6_9ACTN|nr:hypothetical protein GCM10010208_41970 [Actinomadura livida]